MACKRYRELFSAYLDGDLNAKERHSFEDHLEECERCGVEFAGFERVVALTATLPPIQPSSDFDRTLRANLTDIEKGPGFAAVFGRRAIAAFGLICLLVAAAFGAYLIQRGHQSDGEHTQILVGREVVPIVRSYADENILTNFVMPSVPAVKTDRLSYGGVGTTVSEEKTRTLVLPFVIGEHAAQDESDTNYVIKQISLIRTSGETRL